MNASTSDEASRAASGLSNGNGHITEAEASLYDRQIRLWGLEAQNRMRSATVLVLGLRGVAHETIKNTVLAGIGRLIVMDNGLVTEEDLGSGFLFREEDGAVGQERTAAALPQIASLNPLVSLTALPTLAPFVANEGTSDTLPEHAMTDFLLAEKVDVVVACDLDIQSLVAIDAASRQAGSLFYGAGTHGLYGYIFADHGDAFEYVAPCVVKHDSRIQLIASKVRTVEDQSGASARQVLKYASLSAALDREKWEGTAEAGGSPYRSYRSKALRQRAPGATIGILALWEYQKRHARLPRGGDAVEMQAIAKELTTALVDEKSHSAIDLSPLQHLSSHAEDYFPPTLAIVGGLLAQDVLRAISRKDKPICNLLVVDSVGATGVIERWGMCDAALVAE